MKKVFFTFCTMMAMILAGGVATGQQKNLAYFIQQALNNSPLLKDYQNQVQINQADSQRIRATYKPQVTGTSNNVYAPVIKGYGYDGAITNGGQLSALVGVNQALASKKYLDAQFETLRLQNQGIENTARLSEQDLTRTIVAQYITAFGDMQQLHFAREVNVLLKKEENLLKALTENNVYRQTDYLTFLVTRQQQELSVKQLSIQLQNDYATLNYLSGIIDTAEATLAEPELTLHQLPEISQSAFFRKFTLDSLQLGNSRSLIDFNYKPRVSLYADAGYNSTLTYLPYKNFGTSFGVNVTVPIYDGKQKKLQYSKISIAEKTRLGYKDFFTAQYSQQVAQLLQQLKATAELIEEINHQIKYAEGLINVNIKLLETGDAKIADLVIAVNNYMTAKNLLTQNNTSRLQIINQVNYWNR
ncbi:MAG TPA: TolC family protein [Chitinophagaceae bacterium]|nr:TolC family protein [Chitinophagaceae bacterium]